MRIEEREVVQAPRNKKVYIAVDGEEFSSESQCLKHEKLLELKERISHINHKKVDVIDNLCGGEAYYITNENDFKSVESFITESYLYGCNCSGNWNYNGENWYIFYSEDGGDYRDELYCYDLDYYKKMVKEFLEQFEIDLKKS